MLPKQLLLLCFAVASARAQNSDNSNNDNDNHRNTHGNQPLTFSQSIQTLSALPSSAFTGSEFPYLSYSSQSTVSSNTEGGNGTATSTGTSTGTGTNTQSQRTSTSQTVTLIGATTGTGTTSTGTSSTSTGPLPSNTIPCNGYPELCNRKYSNITIVAAHNSAFSIPNNAASNQYFDTEIQLNDGIRMIQGETHYVNDTIYNCHTSCKLLNAGTWQAQLEVIANWVQRHPYDIVTILIVNSDKVSVDKYVPAVQNSGIAQYLYEPEFVPQRKDQWPTLADMIISGKRVVMFMDYYANQTAVPYILDEFTHIWETPFSPTDRNFPCTIGRPPNLNETKAQESWMYLANHNLNTPVRLGSLTSGMGGTNADGSSAPLLIPNTADINSTNGQFDQYGQLEAMRLNCTEKWDHPPQFLLVDYYNYGDPEPGSVFEVAARANGVQYTRDCCGAKHSAASTAGGSFALLVVALGMVVFVWA